MEKVKRADLQEALEKVKPGLASGKEIIEQSTSFAFLSGRVVTYNDEISVSHPVKGLEGFIGAIKAEELYKFLSKITAEEIEVDIHENSFRLKAGKSHAGFTLQKEVTLVGFLPLEEIKDKVKWKPIPKDFIESLKQVTFSCSKDMSTQLYTCVHIVDDGTIESCDHIRATRYHAEPLPLPTFLIPGTSAEDLVKYPVTKIYRSDTKKSGAWVHFKTDDDTVFSCRCYGEAVYDSLDGFLNKDGKILAHITLPDSFGEILERAMIFSKKEHQYDEQMEIHVSSRKLTVKAEGESCQFEEWTKMQGYTGEDFSFAICPRFFVGSLKLSSQCEVTDSQVVFSGKNWKHVIALFK
jgi:hypothetical protein